MNYLTVLLLWKWTTSIRKKIVADYFSVSRLIESVFLKKKCFTFLACCRLISWKHSMWTPSLFLVSGGKNILTPYILFTELNLFSPAPTGKLPAVSCTVTFVWLTHTLVWVSNWPESAPSTMNSEQTPCGGQRHWLEAERERRRAKAT